MTDQIEKAKAAIARGLTMGQFLRELDKAHRMTREELESYGHAYHEARLDPLACRGCGHVTIDVRKRWDGEQLCDLCNTEATYRNQLRAARELLVTHGEHALNNPHGMIGRSCGCGACFCCAAAEVLREARHAR